LTEIYFFTSRKLYRSSAAAAAAPLNTAVLLQSDSLPKDDGKSINRVRPRCGFKRTRKV